MILAGDIGGTHTRLALFERSGELIALEQETFFNRDATSLEEVLGRFLAQKRHEISAACFAIAGPVREGRCQMPNLPWIMDEKLLAQHLKIPMVSLLNDLYANANGLRWLKPDELYVLQRGEKQMGNQALISAGTGLGEAGLFWDGGHHYPFACEGGHVDFAPRNQLEIEFFLFLQNKYGHVSFERAVSGPAIYQIYLFLLQTKRIAPSPEIERELNQKDPSKVISEYGRTHRDAGCREALNLFLSFYGSEAGNTALKFLALGGVYIGGGIAPQLIEMFKPSAFLSSFCDKGRFRELLESIPISIITNNRVTLLGAGAFGRTL